MTMRIMMMMMMSVIKMMARWTLHNDAVDAVANAVDLVKANIDCDKTMKAIMLSVNKMTRTIMLSVN